MQTYISIPVTGRFFDVSAYVTNLVGEETVQTLIEDLLSLGKRVPSPMDFEAFSNLIGIFAEGQR